MMTRQRLLVRGRQPARFIARSHCGSCLLHRLQYTVTIFVGNGNIGSFVEEGSFDYEQINLCNVTASQITVDVQVAGAYLVKGVPIPAGSALSALDGKMIMEAADTCVVTSNTAASVDVILSVLEQGES